MFVRLHYDLIWRKLAGKLGRYGMVVLSSTTQKGREGTRSIAIIDAVSSMLWAFTAKSRAVATACHYDRDGTH
jgi:hypothetical protein